APHSEPELAGRVRAGIPARTPAASCGKTALAWFSSSRRPRPEVARHASNRRQVLDTGLQPRPRPLIDLVEFVLLEPRAEHLGPCPPLRVVGAEVGHDRDPSGLDHAADRHPLLPGFIAPQIAPRLAPALDDERDVAVELDLCLLHAPVLSTFESE